MSIFLTILSLTRSNWKPIAAFAAVAFYSIFCYRAGYKSAESLCQENLAKVQIAIQVEASKNQARADKLAQDAEKKRAEAERKANSIQRRLKDELSKNSNYDQCVITDDFLSIYNDTADKDNHTR